jgi:flagellar motor switch protein FliN/FliY
MTSRQEIEGFSDLLLEVEVQLDRKPVTLRQVLDFQPGALVKLPRSAGDNVDVLMGGTLVCFGEIVIIDDTVGVRITDFREEE